MSTITFRRLAVATALATWALIVVGGIVRVTGSGMGCPDWPKCFGQWIPPLEIKAWIEYVHRLLAASIGALVIAVATVAWRREWRWSALLAVALLAVQVGLGAVTVFTGNRGDTVIAHLLFALLLLAVLTAVAVRARYEPAPGAAGRGLETTRRAPAAGTELAHRGAVALAAVLALALAGAAMQTVNGGFACPGFPGCLGAWWPSADRGSPAQLHMLHRGLALAAGLAVLWVAVPGRRLGGSAARWSEAALVLFGVQFAVGVAQVLVGMPAVLRGAHVALAAALWSALVALTVLVRAPGSQPVPAPAPGAGAAHARSRP